MEDIIVSLEPAFHRVERFILWHNRYASLLAFLIGHCIFYAVARAGLRPFCAIMLVVLMFHILDCLKKKRSHLLANGEENLCDLTQLVLRSYRHVCDTHQKLNTLKTENRVKFSMLIIFICLILACIGMKINGFYVSYITMLILFTLPAVMYHKMLPKLLKRLAPILEQLDQSMEYKRRSLLDQKDLLVKIDRTQAMDDDDDDDVRRLKQRHALLQQEHNQEKRSLLHSTDDDEDEEDNADHVVDDDDDEENEVKLINTNDQSQTIQHFRQRYLNDIDTNDILLTRNPSNANDSSFDMLNDSSTAAADNEAVPINDWYANVNDQFDGRQRIKIKGDEFKIKGRSHKQRPKLMDAQYFRANVNDQDVAKTSGQMLYNASSFANNEVEEPDLTSFDFLNDYDVKHN